MVQVACLCLHITSPKSRETRPAKVAELALYRDRLPEKLRYLADAPQKDPEGNEAIIRFSVKKTSICDI